MDTSESTVGNAVTFIAFGITGDLMRQKILPSLFQLFCKKNLPKDFHIIGVSRQTWDQKKLQVYVAEAIGGVPPTQQKELSSFLELFQFFHGDIHDEQSYIRLKEALAEHEKKLSTPTHKLFYLAIGPTLYTSVLSQLIHNDILEESHSGNVWTRIIIEKPFGNDLASAKSLATLLTSSLKEKQVYLADHYLFKKAVRNIIDFRFAQNEFESRLNNTYVKDIHIKLLEDIGVERRASFYDEVGALRDMGQSHILEILSLLTMEKPLDLKPVAIQNGRAEILQELAIPSPEQISNTTFRAQYQGYRDILGVAPDSHIETYFKVQAALSSPRWQGVPIFLESGKRLAHSLKEIVITYKASGNERGDTLTFPLEPVDTTMGESKKDGSLGEMQEEVDAFWSRADTHTEYGKLLLDCIEGDQTFFVSIQEVMATWRYIDPIVDMWQKNLVPLSIYPQGAKDIIEASKDIEIR